MDVHANCKSMVSSHRASALCHTLTPTSKFIFNLVCNIIDAGEECDYLDLDLVELHVEDFKDITAILELSDTMKDKLTFSVSNLLIVHDRQWVQSSYSMLLIMTVHVCILQPCHSMHLIFIIYMVHVCMCVQLFNMNILLTCFLTGYVPNYFYIWHTVEW